MFNTNHAKTGRLEYPCISPNETQDDNKPFVLVEGKTAD
jgi:hypothetical protein